ASRRCWSRSRSSVNRMEGLRDWSASSACFGFSRIHLISSMVVFLPGAQGKQLPRPLAEGAECQNRRSSLRQRIEQVLFIQFIFLVRGPIGFLRFRGSGFGFWGRRAEQIV